MHRILNKKRERERKRVRAAIIVVPILFFPYFSSDMSESHQQSASSASEAGKQQQQQQGQPPMGQMTPQRQEAQLPQQHHPMGQSPQVDPAQRMMGPAGNDFENENKGRRGKRRGLLTVMFS